jgi:uroporphyrin-III C-methyltransferase/precorrin-2 dehydrogenase/sirohydrochlorin ferrochelatase
MMFGANGATPVTLIENATRADQHVIRSTIQSLSDDLNAANPKGPVIMLYGIGASQAEAVLSQSKQGIV